MNVNEKINDRALCLQWAVETEQYLTRSIQHKGLMRTNRLERSVTQTILGLTTSVKTFVFRYSLHGLFVDMGLFGGRSMEEKADAALVRRITGKRGKRNKKLKNLPKRQYQWYSRTMYGAVNILGRKLMELYGNKATEAFRLPKIIEI